jgi:hypothetical protein
MRRVRPRRARRIGGVKTPRLTVSMSSSHSTDRPHECRPAVRETNLRCRRASACQARDDLPVIHFRLPPGGRHVRRALVKRSSFQGTVRPRA